MIVQIRNQFKNKPMVSSKKILLVDDETDLLEALKETLEMEGYIVSAHSNVDSALNHLRQQPKNIDLVISDMRMPVKNGLDLAMSMRKELKLDTPFLMISGFADITEDDLKNACIKEFLAKPFTIDLFINKINQLMP